MKFEKSSISQWHMQIGFIRSSEREQCALWCN